jgi:hypothetical protein
MLDVIVTLLSFNCSPQSILRLQLERLYEIWRFFIYLYSKTHQMHNISNLFYFGTTLYMFRTVFPSIIRSLRLYIQHHTIQVLWLLASTTNQMHNISSNRTTWAGTAKSANVYFRDTSFAY